MNIFVSYPDPVDCAEFLDKVRANKMLIESCQLLSNAIYHYIYKDQYPLLTMNTRGKSKLLVTDIRLSKANYKKETGLYLPSHPNHPCSKWVLESRANYLWLLDHAYALYDRFVRNSGKSHGCGSVLPLLDYYARFIPEGHQTPFPNCARNLSKGLDFTDIEDVHLAYRTYLEARWELEK